MKVHRAVLLALVCAGGGAALQARSQAKPGALPPDPVTTDPDKYRPVFENGCVRVLRYGDRPGQKTRLHHHPRAFLLYALAPFVRTLTFPDGSTTVRKFDTGDVIWVPAQTHIGENTGASPSDALIVEVKADACR